MTDPTQPDLGGPNEARRWWIAAGAIAAVALIIVLVIVLVSSSSDDDGEVVIDPTSTTSTSTTQPPTTTTAPTPVGPPSVAEFTAAPSPVSCNAPTEVVTLSWKTREAVHVALEVDGVLKPGDLPFDGSTQVAFDCAVAQHSYTLAVTGANDARTSQQVVVQGVTAPTTTPTTAPPTTQPPVTTTTSDGPTTTTTSPDVTQVTVELSDDDDPDGPMTLTIDPDSSTDGKVVFVVENTGDLNHSFLVLKTDTPFDELPVDPETDTVSEADKVGEIAKIKPGKTKKLSLVLEPGSYVVLDNLPGHYAQGARAPFVVLIGS